MNEIDKVFFNMLNRESFTVEDLNEIKKFNDFCNKKGYDTSDYIPAIKTLEEDLFRSFTNKYQSKFDFFHIN